jgi:hypothetical protein
MSSDDARSLQADKESSMWHLPNIPNLDRSGQGVISIAFHALIFRCSVKKEKVDSLAASNVYNDIILAPRAHLRHRPEAVPPLWMLSFITITRKG